MASTMWSVDFRADGKSSTKGISRSSSCFTSRYVHDKRLEEKRGVRWDWGQRGKDQHNVHERLARNPRVESNFKAPKAVPQEMKKIKKETFNSTAPSHTLVGHGIGTVIIDKETDMDGQVGSNPLLQRDQTSS